MTRRTEKDTGTDRRAKTENAALGRTLKQLRKEAGLTQKQVAQALGVSYQQIQKYEKGVSSLAATAVPVLARLYNRPCAVFFDENAAPSLAAVTAEDRLMKRLHRQIMEIKDRQMRLKIARVVTILAS